MTLPVESRVDSLRNSFGFSEFFYVKNRPTVADFFKRGEHPGLYILAFADGAYYAGRTKDLKQRFVAHHRTHGDIEYFAFKPLSIPKQSHEEQALIQQLEATGVTLRNIEHMSWPASAADFDAVVPQPDQDNFLSGQDIQDQSARIVDPNQRARYERSHATIAEKSFYGELVNFLRTYVSLAIPAPRATEMSFWALTVWPSPSAYVSRRQNREWARINLATCEVLTVGHRCTKPSAPIDADVPFVAFHVARSPIAPDEDAAFAELSKIAPSVIDAERKYDVLGGDQIGFLVFGLEEAQRLLEDPRVIGAARRANIAMMRKRACFYARYHCPQLADDILETPV